MASMEQISPTKIKKKHRHEEHRGDKRKRQSTQRSVEKATEKPSNGHVPESTNDSIQTPPPKPKGTSLLTELPFSVSAGKKRINPFSILAEQTDNNDDANSPPAPSTPPQKLSSVPTSVRRAVQFDGDESDNDDFEYTPSKRKKHGKFPARTPHTPKSPLTSPKKLNKKEHLEARVKELEYERRKLPIWTGTFPQN